MNGTLAEPPPTTLRIWYGILGAPIAFSILEVLGWLLDSGSCPAGSPEGYGGVPAVTGTRGVLIGVAVAALLVSLGSLLVGVGEWRRSHDAAFTSIKSYLRPDFLAAAAMLVSAIFALGIVLLAIPIFWLGNCQVMR